MIDLKPCPFCGSDNVTPVTAVAENRIKTYSVMCCDCLTAIFQPRFRENEWDAYRSLEEAIRAWNRRQRDA